MGSLEQPGSAGMEGVEEWETASGVHVFRVHYTANPAKQSKEWREQARRGFQNSQDWDREMEINWLVASGLPIFAKHFNPELHIAKEALRYVEGWTVHRGWDFGLQPACVFTQLDTLGRLYGLVEIVTWDGRGEPVQQGIEDLAPQVQLISNRLFPGATFIDWGDPAGAQKAQTDQKSCYQILREDYGWSVRPGPVAWTTRRRAMIARLDKQVMGAPAIILDARCRMLIEGMRGAYRYERIGETERYKDHPEKNAWSHISEAFQYIVGGLFRVNPNDPDREQERAPILSAEAIIDQYTTSKRRR